MGSQRPNSRLGVLPSTRLRSRRQRGFAGRGGRRANGDKTDHKTADDNLGTFEDEGEFAELRKQYGDKTSVIREMFPDWSEADVLYALKETNGDETEAVTRMADGTISQWGEVSKTKKTARTKAKDTSSAPVNTDLSAGARTARGGRNASDATRRGGRARSTHPTNGSRTKENQQLSVPTEESPAYKDDAANGVEEKPVIVEKAIPAEPVKPAAPQVKTWASMLRQSTAPKVVPALPKEIPAPKPAEPVEPEPVPEAAPVEPEPAKPEPEAEVESTPVVEQATPVVPPPSPNHANATPLSAAQQQHQAQRTATSGYAATALKATTEKAAPRTPSFQRRVLDQEEAVRMPGNREVDRAAVQFGAFNLDDDEDIDGEPPADSPVAVPRTSLPPATQPVAVPETFAPKPTTAPPPGMAPIAAAATSVQAPIPSQPAQPPIPNTQQFGRFGQAGPQDISAAQQKPLDPFNQGAPASQPPFDNFAAQTSQPPAQQPGVAFSSAPSDYSAYYTANPQDRNPYAFYGQHFGQQGAHAQPEGVSSQQRPFGGYNASQTDNLSQYPQSATGHNQPRFGGSNENQNSGHSTPNPVTQAQQQQQPQQQGGPGSQPQAHGQYPGYSHPYYSNPYYHQYYSGYGQGGFGPYGKGAIYGQPYANAPYDHTSSPGTFGPSSLHRESPLGSGLGDYGRAGSAQAGSQPGLGGSSFGSTHDSFSRGASSFQSQGQSFSSQTQPSAGSSGDELKPFGEAKTSSGPSPSLPRPGSATNTAPGGQSGSLPPPQTSQMGGAYGAYPSHLQGHGLHGSGAYGMGAGAGANQHSTPYGSYGQGGFGSGGYYSTGQQQQQQGQQQQQRGGWGGNYH
ncbi:hypothetical protein TrVFT333_007405 [Trichoderma virens FT-333]|nr:hypothetical protein TrVFT333_007405 [Trichoderma virens FT-333]